MTGRSKRGKRCAALWLCALGLCAYASAAEEAPLVTAETRLAITGDSITEQKLYSKFMELYLAVCAPQRPAAVMQFGWGGDRAPGFAGRMQHDCLDLFRPTLLTTVYGMNDGGYRAYGDGIGKAYRDGMERLIQQAVASGAKVLVGGPGAVDSTTFRKDAKQAATYNESLGRLSGLARELAQANGLPFADVHQTCMDAMAKAKAALGDAYAVMGNDGVHPGENGQLAMAYAFLNGMGFSGEIAHITVDVKDGSVAVKGEHDAKRLDNGTIELTSRRWPFCFTGADNGQTTLAMQAFIPFNDDLNRFTLVVKGLETPFADVSWGGQRKRFERAALEAGVNLAAAFAGRTPFQNAWGRLEQAVRRKQEMETTLVKGMRSPMRGRYQQGDDAEKAKLDTFWTLFMDVVWGHLADEVAKVASEPVTHALTIKPSDGQAVVIKADLKDVPEAAGYRLIYDMDLNQLRGETPAYTTDVSEDAAAFTRVAYFLELGDGENPDRWVWASMDAFTNDVKKIGIPSVPAKTVFHQALTGLNVRTNVEEVSQGEGFAGWIEFWPCNYTPNNVKQVPNASDQKFDWGDIFDGDGLSAGYGSMQIHHPDKRQVVFALNNWRTNGPDRMDVGIGNNPETEGNKHPDYTFSNNSNKYKTKRLRVFVK